MAIFAIYRYTFSTFKKLEGLFQDSVEGDSHSKYNSPEEVFESFFDKAGAQIPGIAELVTKGRGKKQPSEWVSHGNEIEQHKENIIVFRLQANKTKNINKEDWTKEKVGHYPDCRVIIDNREQSHLMVIERKTSSYKDPDDAKQLLEDSFNRLIHDYGINIKFERLTKHKLFWDAVNEIRSTLGDEVCRVQFDFAKDEPMQKDDGSFTYKLLQWASLFSESSSITMNVGNDERLKEVEKDLTRMSELCYQNRNYNLTVKFRDFGLYKYGQDIKAQYGLDDETIECFIENLVQLECFDDSNKAGLIKWFDNINILFDSYDNKACLASKRNKGGRV